MRRPGDLFDREIEWNDLARFITDPSPGVQLALLRGRRRQGKSFLLRRAVDKANGFYYQAVQQEKVAALADFGRALATHVDAPTPYRFQNWSEALSVLADESAPKVVAFDECPYLLENSPELTSVLQRFIDEHKSHKTPIRIIICGSVLAVMTKLLYGSQALRGRASLDMLIRPFDFRTSAKFWGVTDPATALRLNACVGGTPGYKDISIGNSPQSLKEFDEWVCATLLNPSSALFREDEYLLTEEQGLTDRSLYQTVVSAIAGGARSQGAIAAKLARTATQIQYPLRSLVETGFITATDDALRSRRPFYSVAEPIIRFHHSVTRHERYRFEDRQTAKAWKASQQRFKAQVLGPHFEQVARDFVAKFAADETAGGVVSSVAPAVISDPSARTQHEIDVVALCSGDTSDAGRVVAIGEAKHTKNMRSVADIERLEHIRTLIEARHPDKTGEPIRLLVFSASGFTKAAVRSAKTRSDVELIDLPRLYTGQ